jgi:hypothetical protein
MVEYGHFGWSPWTDNGMGAPGVPGYPLWHNSLKEIWPKFRIGRIFQRMIG